jgi:hypothetical protein
MKQQAIEVPVKFSDYKDSVIKVAEILWVPTVLCDQGTFCFKPRGIILVESTQIKWCQDVQAGEAGPIELQLSRGQESQN